jgi:outer membrane protein OmpA-like peptidoglycan-associated protein
MEARQLDIDWYAYWTKFIAVLLAVLLLLLWLFGAGPTSQPCCGAAPAIAPLAVAPAPTASAPTASAPVVTVASTPASPASVPAFHFTANAQGLTAAGATAAIGWWGQRSKLSDLLAQNQHVEISGDAAHVTLTGMVASAEQKEQVGQSLQALIGPQVALDNQLVVEAPVVASAPVASQPAAAPITMPPTVKVYFALGKFVPPTETPAHLADVVSYLKAHPDSKAVIVGYHDPSGNAAWNAVLAKRRAEAVQAALEQAGIAAGQTELHKPQDTTGSGDPAQARRVDVSVQ